MNDQTKSNVVFGLVGTKLDEGRGTKRWFRWRPSVAVCQHPAFPVARFELIIQPRFRPLGDFLVGDIRSVSPSTTVRLVPATFDDPWDFEDVYGALHDIAAGYTFDLDRENYFVHITTGSHVAQICMFLLTESRYFPARLLQSAPAREGRSDPEGVLEFIDLDLSRYDRLASRFVREKLDRVSALKSGIATRNEGFNRLIDRIERVAIGSSDPVLLAGPTGAGKSQLARRIYELRRSRHLLKGDFVEVNCATLRGDAAMSALFGHVKGAFTGAMRDRPGLLRAANGGLLFLDEIGELGLDEQAMLLRALEEKTFLPLGADREARSDFQLIAGSNRDLAARAATGQFRDDLLARINLWTFGLPSLAERREDIEPNLEYELDAFARRAGRRVGFSREARDRFLRFACSRDAAWTGNFRDLNAAVTRMATLAPGGRITTEVVDEEIARLRAAWKSSVDDADGEVLASVLDTGTIDAMDLFDRLQLAGVIRVCRRSRSLSDAGRALFNASRDRRSSTNDADRLRKYLARFGLAWKGLSDE